MTDADFADDMALFVNVPALAESILHRQKQAAGGIVFNVNSKQKQKQTNKTDYVYFR